jgi:hypothetical protein
MPVTEITESNELYCSMHSPRYAVDFEIWRGWRSNFKPLEDAHTMTGLPAFSRRPSKDQFYQLRHH